MSTRRITSSLRAPTNLSSLHSVNWGLFVRRFRSSPFRISNLEPLFTKHPGGGTPTSTPSLLPVRQVLCCLSHTRNHRIFMHLRTLLRNGNPLFPLFSILSALFLSSQGVVHPPLDISKRGAATTAASAPPGRRRCGGQSPQSKSSDSLPKRLERPI